MDIQKDFELRRCGEKIVLRQLMPPEYDFKTVFVADALVETKHSSSSLFVLKKKGEYLLCRHKHGCLNYVRATDYEVTSDGLFYCSKGYWYLWQKDLSSLGLGQKIGKDCNLFVEKTSEGYVLRYFDDRKVCEKLCKSYELLDGYPLEKELLDFMKLETEEGVEFVSLRSVLYHSVTFPQGRSIASKHVVVFSRESSEQKVAFCKFAQEFVEQKMQEGFSSIAFWEKELVRAVFSHEHENFKIALTSSLSSPYSYDVKIVINIWALFNKNSVGAYRVECKDLSYQQAADDVRFVATAEERALFVKHDGTEDKLFGDQKTVTNFLKRNHLGKVGE